MDTIEKIDKFLRLDEKETMASKYLNTKVDYGGEMVRIGDIVKGLQKAGVPQRYIDAYLAGMETKRKRKK